MEKFDEATIDKFIKSCKKNGFNKTIPNAPFFAMNVKGDILQLLNSEQVKLHRKSAIEDAEFEDIETPKLKEGKADGNINNGNKESKRKRSKKAKRSPRKRSVKKKT